MQDATGSVGKEVALVGTALVVAVLGCWYRQGKIKRR